jgi:hypothetical protein
MGLLSNYAKRLKQQGQETDQALMPKKKKLVPIPPPQPTPPTAIPSPDEMQKKIEGFKKKGWIK